jgi:Ca-activated chloride channel family protein
LTIHVVGYRVKDFSWTGEQSILDVRCLAEQNGGLYIAAESKEDLVEALRKTLDCPMVTQRTSQPGSLEAVRLASQGALRRLNH